MALKGTIQEVDAQRARWAAKRQGQALTLDAGEDFALGGLGRHTEALDARLVCLPSDPLADAVPLDQETLAWLKQSRQSPYGGRYPSWGSRERATSGALVLYDQYREDAGWTHYLALHRHGGIEVGLSHLTYEIRAMTGQLRVFALRSIVGAAWAAAAMQNEVLDQWHVQMPFELTIGVRNTSRATLGGFAEGWANPGQGLGEFTICLEDHLLLRHEADDGIDPERYALDLGDRIEQAFGSISRRHLARVGEYVGRFDPSF